MLNVSRLLCARSVFFCLLLAAAGSTAEAQTTSTNPALDRQLSRIDLGVLGVGVFNKNSNGFATVNGRANTAVNLNPSNTAGAAVSLPSTILSNVWVLVYNALASATNRFSPFFFAADSDGHAKPY